MSSGVLTFEMIKKAMERIKEPPKREIIKCKSCDCSILYTGWEYTKKIDGLNYFICISCAIHKGKP